MLNKLRKSLRFVGPVLVGVSAVLPWERHPALRRPELPTGLEMIEGWALLGFAAAFGWMVSRSIRLSPILHWVAALAVAGYGLWLRPSIYVSPLTYTVVPWLLLYGTWSLYIQQRDHSRRLAAIAAESSDRSDLPEALTKRSPLAVAADRIGPALLLVAVVLPWENSGNHYHFAFERGYGWGLGALGLVFAYSVTRKPDLTAPIHLACALLTTGLVVGTVALVFSGIWPPEPAAGFWMTLLVVVPWLVLYGMAAGAVNLSRAAHRIAAAPDSDAPLQIQPTRQ